MDSQFNNEITLAQHVAVIGGTFDTLHQGHKEYIKLAFNFAHKVHILLRTNGYAQDSKQYEVKPYQLRQKQLQSFIGEIGYQDRYDIHSMESEKTLFAFCLSHSEISLAVLGPEYYQLFKKINKMREQKGLNSLLILVKWRTRAPDGNDLNSTLFNGNRSFNELVTKFPAIQVPQKDA